MSVKTVVYGAYASILTYSAVIQVAEMHKHVRGALLAGGAIACAITSINCCVRESFKAASKEASKEIKPTEAGSPVPETAAATSPRRRELSEAERNVIAASVLDP